MSLIRQISGLVESTRCNLSDEKKTQAQLELAFVQAGFTVSREHRLSAQDIADFVIDGVAVEVKIKGQRQAIFRQLERYAAHDEVQSILLVTAVSMQLPDTINGKPARVASLGRAWL